MFSLLDIQHPLAYKDDHVMSSAPPSGIPASSTVTDSTGATFAIPTLPSRARPGHVAAPDPSHWPQGSTEHKDASVQGTSDDAATSKMSAQSLGYFQDEFLPAFVPPQQQARRPPLINRGYWARVAAVTQMIDEFLRAGEDEQSTTLAAVATAAPSATPASSAIPPSSPFYRAPSLPPPPPFTPTAHPARIHKQILSLGAGSDTNYFKLKSAGREPFRYVEIDFPVAVQRKAQTIRRHQKMFELVSKRGPRQTEEEAKRFLDGAAKQIPDPALDLPSSDYALVGADLRDLKALEAGLLRAQVDFTLPTLILSECVLIYMNATDSSALLSYLTSKFTGGCVIWTYEQLHPYDAFGVTMRANLENRGCSLLGFTAYPDLAAQSARYLSSGFKHYKGWDMNDIYRYSLGPLEEVKRVERLELFDEFEEWNMIQAHYHISVASKEPVKDQGSEEQKGEIDAVAPSSADLSSPLRIDWSKIGLLGKTKQLSVLEAAQHASQGSITTSTGRTVLLGGAGVRASAPLNPTPGQYGMSNTANPAKGSLKKPNVE